MRNKQYSCDKLSSVQRPEIVDRFHQWNTKFTKEINNLTRACSSTYMPDSFKQVCAKELKSMNGAFTDIKHLQTELNQCRLSDKDIDQLYQAYCDWIGSSNDTKKQYQQENKDILEIGSGNSVQ